MSAATPSTQLAVIGAGPGGYAAAFLAADLGLDVTLIDPAARPGGVCLYRGCIPSKALLHIAKVMTDARHAAAWGVKFPEPTVELDAVRAWKDDVVASLTRGLSDLAKTRKVTYLRGRARLHDATTLVVTAKDGSESRLSFEHAIIATGSHPVIPESFRLDSPRVMNSTTALKLPDIPERLLVVGGGYIGLELGTVYAALGSRVTVVELTHSLLPGVDTDLVRPLAKRLANVFADIRCDARVVSMTETGDGIQVSFEGANAPSAPEEFDKALLAIGREPNTRDLGLGATSVTVDEHGFICVDEQRRTAEPTLFAIGDVAGQPMLAHKASHEGRTAVEVIAGGDATFAPRAIPAVVFTDPEIAWCGLTEAEAKADGRTVTVARFPWGASGRAATLGRSDGVTKLVIDPETERILGVGVTGSGAGELIAEGVLAIEMKARAVDLARSIHPHPTLSETVMEAADVFFGHSTHLYRPRRK